MKFSTLILLVFSITLITKVNAQYFGYQGNRFEINIGTEISLNRNYYDNSRYKNSDTQSAYDISMSKQIGLNFSLSRRVGIGFSYATQNLFIGYRVPKTGSIFLYNGSLGEPTIYKNNPNIEIYIKDKNRYRNTSKIGVNFRYNLVKRLGNASSYLSLEIGQAKVEKDNDEQYTYYTETVKGPIYGVETSSTSQIIENNYISNTEIPAFIYFSFGGALRKELWFKEGLFIDFETSITLFRNNTKADFDEGEFQISSEESGAYLSDRDIQEYIIANSLLYLKKQQLLKFKISLNYLF